MKPVFEYTPRQIVKELDYYIIGQDDAKRSVAIALRNRWRRKRVTGEIRDEIIPNNILMIGTTGVGKTEIARRLAKLAGAPFVKVEASKFTEVGYVGRDVEGMVRDLVETAVSQVRSEKTTEVEEEARDHVEERLLDLLLPLPDRSKKKSGSDSVPFLFGADDAADDENKTLKQKLDETEAARQAQRQERYERSREKMRTKLRNGDLEDRQVDIRIPEKTQGIMQVFGPIGLEEMGINLQELFGGMTPKKHKQKTVTISEARSLILGEEVDKLLDMDAVITEAIRRSEEMGIIFLDEVDKIAGYDSGQGPDVSREGVQRDILPIVEGTRVSTKYGPVNTDHILFIAAGAFHISKPSDLIPELQGRFPIRVELDNLTNKDFLKILTEPRNSLVKQYQALFEAEGVELTYDKAALREIANLAMHVNDTTENIGARRLHTMMNSLHEEDLFRVPNRRIKTIHVTKDLVKERLQYMVDDDDLSRYIL